ncbi:biotin/lipoyl-containing protein [Acidisphaera sp. L21]|uniref:acetyl-CoA carboxylase biotin carboxyl carrier protein n=1 Tax=Acidisphaera sp. L21 TaxID=1641851 RepID=UPI00131C6D8C|nr:biotin/lipoyl-containing protein [Acidisphaera sp. L21]
MNIDRLTALVEHALNAGTSLSQYDEGGLRLTIRSLPHGATQASRPDTSLSIPPSRNGADTVHSALFGLFHLQPSGGAEPFVSLGQQVEAGQKIGLIEAMKVFSPVLSHRAGRIVAVLAEHGAEVECGQPLFHME